MYIDVGNYCGWRRSKAARLRASAAAGTPACTYKGGSLRCLNSLVLRELYVPPTVITAAATIERQHDAVACAWWQVGIHCPLRCSSWRQPTHSDAIRCPSKCDCTNDGGVDTILKVSSAITTVFWRRGSWFVLSPPTLHREDGVLLLSECVAAKADARRSVRKMSSSVKT
jgi:hypothetical protein